MGFPANKGGSFLDMPVNGFLKVDVTRFHEQSIPVIELTNFMSDFNYIFFENGFKIIVRDAVRLTGLARPNFTNFAALHFLGSSCFNMRTLRFTAKIYHVLLIFYSKHCKFFKT